MSKITENTRAKADADRFSIEQIDQLGEQLRFAINDGDREGIRECLADVYPADIAQVLESMPPSSRLTAWHEVPLDLAGEVLSELHEGVRDDLIDHMDREQLVFATRFLEVDDLADLLTDLPSDAANEVKAAVDDDARENLDTLLSYPEDTAGGLMNVDTIVLRDNVPITVVLRYLRKLGRVPEYTDKLFVVNRRGHLIGTLSTDRLLTAQPATMITQHTDNDPVTFDALDSADEVAAAFARYDLVSAPVLNDAHELIGRITVDDVVDVIREEADHSVMARAGLDEEEDLFAPATRTTRSRAVWLGVNLITAVLASWVIGRFEHAIEQLVALAVLMPIVASMGGNAGTQTLTVTIRGLGLGTVTRANSLRLLAKEMMVGAMNGLLWAVVVGLVAFFWYQNTSLALIVAFAMVINLLVSSIAGVLLPITFDRLGIDPALAGGVALSTITDVIGFMSILGLAALLIL